MVRKRKGNVVGGSIGNALELQKALEDRGVDGGVIADLFSRYIEEVSNDEHPDYVERVRTIRDVLDRILDIRKELSGVEGELNFDGEVGVDLDLKKIGVRKGMRLSDLVKENLGAGDDVYGMLLGLRDVFAQVSPVLK